MRIKPLQLVFVVGSIGCTNVTEPYDDVILAPSKAEYTRGATLTLEMINLSHEAIGYGGCSLQPERLTSSGWILAGPEGVLCDAMMRVLGSGRSTPRQLLLEKSLPPGRYRLRETVYPGTTRPTRTVHSSEFVVRDAG
jgi:hypothetical protein